FASGKDEVIVGDGCLARIDRVAAGDLIERVNGKRRGPVGSRQQIRVDLQRVPGPHFATAFVDAVRPDNLLRCRQEAREFRRWKFDNRTLFNRAAKLTSSAGE